MKKVGLPAESKDYRRRSNYFSLHCYNNLKFKKKLSRIGLNSVKMGQEGSLAMKL